MTVLYLTVVYWKARAFPQWSAQSHQVNKSPSTFVGARVAERGKEDLDGRPPWFAWKRWLVVERAACPLPRATIKDFVGE
jgi:hypothetical protein